MQMSYNISLTLIWNHTCNVSRSNVTPEIGLLDCHLLSGPLNSDIFKYPTNFSAVGCFAALTVCGKPLQPGRSRSATASTHSQAAQHVRRMKRRVTDTWKARNLQGWRLKMALENTVRILLRLKKKRHFIGKEMTPLDLLSCDVSVFQACHPTIFNAHESNIFLWSMFDCCSSM